MNLLMPNVVTKQATFAAGCFWGVEAMYGATKGVIKVKSGYTGGTKVNPTYHALDDHTEAVHVHYDPEQTNYSELLNLFWNSHDPTSYFKRQYMSAIYYHDEEQKQLAEKSKQEAQKLASRPIKTEIAKASTFYDAEDYHQKYYLRNVPGLFSSLQLDGQQVKDSYVAAKLNGYIGGYGKYEDFVEVSKTLGLSDSQRQFALNVVKDPPFAGCH